MIHETPQDRKNQHEIAERLAAIWKCRVIKMPDLHPVDYLIGNDSGAAWIEIKKRNAKSTTYKTLMIDKSKIEAGVRHSEATGFPFVVVVHWDDGIFYAAIGGKYQTAIGGRADRVDPNDTDVVCHIPVEHFRRLQ